jgi:alpha-aminoadipate carrier protein LysW
MAVACPVCDAAIDIDEDELDEGDALTCDECGADLRVAGVDPLELESLDEDEDEEDDLDLDEDDDDDEDEDEEEEEDWK